METCAQKIWIKTKRTDDVLITTQTIHEDHEAQLLEPKPQVSVLTIAHRLTLSGVNIDLDTKASRR